MDLYIDGHHGIYIPQMFAERANRNHWNIKADDLEILLAGPDHEYYLETWDDVLDYAEATLPDGGKLSLYQDDDLWLVEKSDFEPGGQLCNECADCTRDDDGGCYQLTSKGD